MPMTLSSLEQRLASRIQEHAGLAEQTNAELLVELQSLRPLPGLLEEHQLQAAEAEDTAQRLRLDLAASHALAQERLCELGPLRPLPTLLSEATMTVQELRQQLLSALNESRDRHREKQRAVVIQQYEDELHALRPLPRRLADEGAGAASLRRLRDELQTCDATIGQLEQQIVHDGARNQQLRLDIGRLEEATSARTQRLHEVTEELSEIKSRENRLLGEISEQSSYLAALLSIPSRVNETTGKVNGDLLMERRGALCGDGTWNANVFFLTGELADPEILSCSNPSRELDQRRRRIGMFFTVMFG
ncbi:hypothetical protein AURDEDRAFT_167719 [Auricularia subglabra TFB-10046 SS5]|nr:hypothetical protein AURDEDRAFT_167719 [Auricularia subglabra TFB-10046 SS5]